LRAKDLVEIVIFSLAIVILWHLKY